MTVSPGWYGDGVTPGVERWFDGRGWTETTRALAPAPPATMPAAMPATPAPAATASGTVWVPQDMPDLPGVQAWSAQQGTTVPTYDGVSRSTPYASPGASPASDVPTREPEPVRAPSAAAAGYPTAGTPYRAAASPYTGATASPPATSPYAPYPGGPTSEGHPTAGYPGAGYPGAGYPGAGYPASRFGTPPGPPGAGLPRTASPELVESMFRSQAAERADTHRQSAVVMGIIGVVLLVIAGGILRATVSTGTGAVWTWGFLGGGVFLVKAAMSYVRSVRGGGRHFGPVGWTVSGGALLLAGVMVVTSLQAALSPMDVEVGSCFTDEGPEVQHVDCAAPHDYTTVGVVDALGECPAITTVYARLDGDVVCLVDAGLGFGD